MPGFLVSGTIYDGGTTDLEDRPYLATGRRPWLAPMAEMPGSEEVWNPQVISPLSWASPLELAPAFAFVPFQKRPHLVESTIVGGIWSFPWVPVLPGPVIVAGNVFVNLPVPSGPGNGPWVNVGASGRHKTILVVGITPSAGNFHIDGSMDGTRSCYLYGITGGTIPNSLDGITGHFEITGIFQYLRVRRDGSGGAPMFDVGGQAAGCC